MKDKLIVKARITAMPKTIMEPMPQVWVTLEGETEESKLFEFYPDEVMFKPEEFIGKTKREGLDLFGKKDGQWLRSPGKVPVA